MPEGIDSGILGMLSMLGRSGGGQGGNSMMRLLALLSLPEFQGLMEGGKPTFADTSKMPEWLRTVYDVHRSVFGVDPPQSTIDQLTATYNSSHGFSDFIGPENGKLYPDLQSYLIQWRDNPQARNWRESLNAPYKAKTDQLTNTLDLLEAAGVFDEQNPEDARLNDLLTNPRATLRAYMEARQDKYGRDRDLATIQTRGLETALATRAQNVRQFTPTAGELAQREENMFGNYGYEPSFDWMQVIGPAVGIGLNFIPGAGPILSGAWNQATGGLSSNRTRGGAGDRGGSGLGNAFRSLLMGGGFKTKGSFSKGVGRLPGLGQGSYLSGGSGGSGAAAGGDWWNW